MTPQERIRGLLDFTRDYNGPDFQITFVFDSTRQGHRLIQIAERLVSERDRELLFRFSLCNYEKFHTSSGREWRHGSDADVVLLAAKAPIPEGFWDWFASWAAQRRHSPAALAVDLQEEAVRHLPALRRICAIHGIDFIAEASSLSSAGPHS